MYTFRLRSYNQKEEIRNPHFFILNKGNNSGKPLLSPCPNCFVIQFQSETEKEQLYWLMYSLWQSKAFYPYLRGSVIPFVILRDMKKCIADGLEKMETNPGQFQKVVETLRSLEEMEKKFRQNLKLLQDAKRMLFYKYM
jgi:Negative regulator of septation ring formation